LGNEQHRTAAEKQTALKLFYEGRADEPEKTKKVKRLRPEGELETGPFPLEQGRIETVTW